MRQQEITVGNKQRIFLITFFFFFFFFRVSPFLLFFFFYHDTQSVVPLPKKGKRNSCVNYFDRRAVHIFESKTQQREILNDYSLNGDFYISSNF